VRTPVETSLDLGTGCGIQALLSARHSGRVVATDVNERALGFAGFNAQLNGVDNVEFRAGSLFAPVEGMRFGRLTCNPPYVISPESAFLFRDSGLEGDTVSRHVVERVPEHLEEGAFGQMLVSWVVAPDADWSDAPRSWVDASGCDAWLLHDSTVDPLTHAGAWLRHEVGSDAKVYGDALDRWLAYYERLGIEQIAVGAVILRRRSGANWVLATELPSERLRPAGDHILRVFAAQDFLMTLADERELLAERLARPEHSRLEQRVVYADGRWSVVDMTLSLQDGLGFHAGLDATTGRMLAALEGERTLGDVAGELALAEGVSREEAERTLVPVAARMLSAGFLVRV
jgi:methylase of polypeptide subunit release factors